MNEKESIDEEEEEDEEEKKEKEEHEEETKETSQQPDIDVTTITATMTPTTPRSWFCEWCFKEHTTEHILKGYAISLRTAMKNAK